MNYEETLSTLKAIQTSYSPMPFLLDPDVEPRFVINSDERTIEIPEEFKFLAVKMDHLSERIYFDIPRYFDGEDLATKICVVQYINANGEEAAEGIAAIVDVDYTSEADKIIFRWDVDNNVTKYAGDVSFSVRFYTISDDNRFTYSWNTVPATLPVLDTIDNTGQRVTENYPTELLQWQYRMTELDRTISEKIATATKSIDTNTKAAQAARQGAEDAESRVNAIVAGNEAYTKKQSHDLFALALKGTAEAAKSITIYPDKGSNVLATINGFTQQEGTGDPSPSNVRKLINGGLKLVEVVLTGTEGWVLNPNSGTAASGSRRFQLGMSVTSSNASAYVVAVAYCSHFDGTTPANTYGSNYDNTFSVQNADLQLRVAGISAVDDLKRFLAARYAAGDPVIVWYEPADEADATGLYAPLTGTGDGHTGVCRELTAPLCQGDTLITKVKSGCDKMIVLDGSEDEGWYESNTSDSTKKRWYTKSGIIESIALNSNDQVFPGYSSWLAPVSGNATFAKKQGISASYSTSALALYIEQFSAPGSIEEFKAYLSANPLTVWYRSTGYTDNNNKPVSLEMHVRWAQVLNGKEAWATAVAGAYYMFPGNLPKPSGGGTTTDAISDYLKAVPTNDIAAGTEGFGIGPSGSIVVRLPGGVAPSTYMANKPLTVVYQLNSAVTFAHDPVDFIADPDDDGAWVITGEADGTVSAEYNKSITKAFEEILTRVSALELHALGG